MNLQEQRNDDNIDVLIFLSNIKKAFGGKNSHHVSYLPKSYLWTKHEINRFFSSCHEIKILLDFS